MRPAERIRAIKEIAALLGKREWPEIDLVLRQHRAPTTDEWEGDRQRGGRQRPAVLSPALLA
jgi:hypothetical protein